MSDQKTILPAAALVALYKDTLVIPNPEIKSGVQSKLLQNKETPAPALEVEVKTKVVKTAGPLKYLGDHHKKILVIVNDPNSVYLNEADFILLTSILNACKLTIADIALVNIGNQETSLHQILETVPSQIIMCFDIAPVELKIKLPTTLYKLNELGESVLFFSKPLSSMQGTGSEAKLEKGILWNLLKKIFKI
jgi:hypothetical protein